MRRGARLRSRIGVWRRGRHQCRRQSTRAMASLRYSGIAVSGLPTAIAGSVAGEEESPAHPAARGGIIRARGGEFRPISGGLLMQTVDLDAVVEDESGGDRRRRCRHVASLRRRRGRRGSDLANLRSSPGVPVRAVKSNDPVLARDGAPRSRHQDARSTGQIRRARRCSRRRGRSSRSGRFARTPSSDSPTVQVLLDAGSGIVAPGVRGEVAAAIGGR